jgi:homoserine dehydrogenase
VIADLIDTLVGRTAITFKTLALWAEDRNAPVPVRDSAEVRGRFYLRLKVEDRPGVLAEISGILGRHNISIASVIQHETDEPADGVVPLVIMTHAAPEGALEAALGAMGRLPCVRPGTVRLRVRD